LTPAFNLHLVIKLFYFHHIGIMATEPVAGPQRLDEYERAQPHDPVQVVEAAEEEHATESHVLANADHEEKGAAQHDHGETEVRDLGWNEKPHDVPNPLVGGLPNEELWTLVRRFNKVCILWTLQDLH
jgi:hypothetical protein